MALDRIGLSLVRMLALEADLGEVLTLGRQSLEVGPLTLRRSFPNSQSIHESVEGLLINELGAESCVSLDASAFENATLIHDMNIPIPNELAGRFDCVFDFGTLEHVFDVKTAFLNVTQLCREGGLIAHILPANSFCGHGFYQFSPSFFLSYYSTNRGFSNTRIYFAESKNPTKWWKVKENCGKSRVDVKSRNKLFLIVVTTPMSNADSFPVQQSDYVAQWESSEITVVPDFDSRTRSDGAVKRFVRRSPFNNIATEFVKFLRERRHEGQRLWKSPYLSVSTERQRLGGPKE